MVKRGLQTPIMHRFVEHNGIIAFGGLIADDLSQTMGGQTAQICQKLDKLLAEAGTDKTRILSAQIWLADMADFAEMNAVWDAWVDPANPPARATVEAKLAAPEYLVEIVVVAAKGQA